MGERLRELDTDTIHAGSVGGNGLVLCGSMIDAGMERTSRPMDCSDCIRIIQFCKKIRSRENAETGGGIKLGKPTRVVNVPCAPMARVGRITPMPDNTDNVEKVAMAIFAEAEKDSVGGAYVGEFDFPDGRGKTTCLDGEFDLRAFARAAIEALDYPTILRRLEKLEREVAS